MIQTDAERSTVMRILLNILWIIFGGFISALGWWFTGILWCISIIGIPVGKQCFKLSSISLNPFGKEISYERQGAGSALLNFFWFIFGGLEMALANFLLGAVLCVTIIGIPWGKQFFKIAAVSFMPFGAEVKVAHVF